MSRITIAIVIYMYSSHKIIDLVYVFLALHITLLFIGLSHILDILSLFHLVTCSAKVFLFLRILSLILHRLISSSLVSFHCAFNLMRYRE
jgi:hypothetical protein